MAIPESERAKMRAVNLCGDRVLERLEGIGISGLADLRGADPEELVQRVNVAAGYPIWRSPRAVQAMANLIAAANAEAPVSPSPAHRAGYPLGGGLGGDGA